MGISFLKRKKTKGNFILENYSPPPTPDRDVDEESLSPHRPLAVLQPASDNSIISPNINNDDMNEEEKVTLSLIHKRSMGNEVGRPPVLVTPTKKQLSDATGTSSAGGSAGGDTPDTHIVSPPPALMSSHETPVHSNQQNLNKDVNEFIEEEKNTKIIIKEAEALLKKDKKKKSKKEKKKKKKNFFGILPSKKDTAPISPMSTEEQDVSIPNDPDTSQYQTEILERVVDVDAGSDEDVGVELGLSMSMNTTQQEEQLNVETIAAGGKAVDIANWVPPSPVDDDVDQQPVVNVFDANTRTANGDNMNEADALSETGGKNNLAPTSLFDNDDDGGTGEEEDEGTDDIAQQAMPALIPDGSAILSGVTSQGTKKKKKGLWKAINRGKSSRSRKFLYSSELSQQQQGQQQPSASSAGDRPTTPHSTIPSNKTPVTTTTDKSEKISKASLGLPEVPQDITADEDSSMPSMLSEPEIIKQQRAVAAMNSPHQPNDQQQGDDGRNTPANNTAKYSASTRPTSPGGTAGMMSSTMGETNTSASGAGFTTGLSTVTSLGRTYMSSASQAGGIDKLLSVFTCGDDTTIGNAVANVTNVMQCNKIPLVCGMGGELAKDEVDIELEMEEEHTLNFQNDIIKNGVKLIYHESPSKASTNANWIQSTVKLFLRPGNYCNPTDLKQPTLAWAVLPVVSRMMGSFDSSDRINQAWTTLGLLDVHSILVDKGAISTGFFSITATNGGVYVFEAPSADVRDEVVMGLKAVISRVTYHLMQGNADVIGELFSEDAGQLTGELPSLVKPWKVLTKVTYDFLQQQ